MTYKGTWHPWKEPENPSEEERAQAKSREYRLGEEDNNKIALATEAYDAVNNSLWHRRDDTTKEYFDKRLAWGNFSDGLYRYAAKIFYAEIAFRDQVKDLPAKLKESTIHSLAALFQDCAFLDLVLLAIQATINNIKGLERLSKEQKNEAAFDAAYAINRDAIAQADRTYHSLRGDYHAQQVELEMRQRREEQAKAQQQMEAKRRVEIDESNISEFLGDFVKYT
jgi:hypothetical protein